MTFLAPLFLLGLIGVAVPVILHLTRHERGKPTPFPSLMFLERIPFQETARRRIRHWSLLLLRALALALLVAAFARPFFQEGSLSMVGGPGPQELIILLDQSYSMARDNVWEEALTEARALVNEASTLDRISLIVFSQTPSILHRSTTDRQRVLAALDTLTPGSLATRFGPAVKVAASTLAASTLPRGYVVLISDMQRVGWRPDGDAQLPEGTAFELRTLGEAEVDNVAITDLELTRTSASGRDRMTVRARAVNHSPDSVQVAVELTIDGSLVQGQTVDIAGRSAAAVEFAAYTLSQPFTQGQITLSDDGLAGDNRLSFVVSPGNNLDVLIVDPAGQGESNLYLRQAMGITSEGGFGTLVIRGAPSEAQLAAHDVVVLNGAPFPGGAGGTRLRQFVADGGGLLIALGPGSRWPADQAGMFPGELGRIADTDPDEGRLGFVDYDHPVFEIFRGERMGDFSRARFYRIRNVAVTTGRVLARLGDGSAALIEGRVEEGRVLVWTSGLDRLWNDLALQPVYLPFIQQMVRHLGGQAEAPEWHLAGSTVDLLQIAEASGLAELPPGVMAVSPHGDAIPLDAEAPLLILGQSGVWEIRSPGSRPERPLAIAVNADVEESDLTRLNLEEFTGAMGVAPDGEATTTTANGFEIKDGDLERRQSFWRYLLMLVFLLLAGETLLANWLSRNTLKEAATL